MTNDHRFWISKYLLGLTMNKNWTLGSIFEALKIQPPINLPHIPISKIEIRPKECTPGSLFIPDNFHLRSSGYLNEEDAIKTAIAHGASAAITSLDHLPFKTAIPVLKFRHPTSIIAALAKKARSEYKGKTIAITGSVGKTSTKDVIATTLENRGNIYKTIDSGNAIAGVCQTIINTPNNANFCVVEVGVSRPGHMAHAAYAKPDIGIITNIGLSHLMNYKNKNELFKEKISIFDHLSGMQVGIIHESILEEKIGATYLAQKTLSRLIKVGNSSASDVYCSNYNFFGTRTEGVISVFQKKFPFLLQLPSPHFIPCALFAVACSVALDLDVEGCLGALGSIQLTSHRFERSKITLPDGHMELIDDSCNAAPASMKALLEVLSQRKAKRKVLVWGDMLELGEHSNIYHNEIAMLANLADLDLLITVGTQTKSASMSVLTAAVINYDNWEEASLNSIDQFRCGDLIAVKASAAIKLTNVVDKIKTLGVCTPAERWSIENDDL